MSDTTRTPPTIRVRLVVPHLEGRRVLAVDHDLPSIDVVADPTTLAAVAERLPTVALAGPVVESVIDFTPDDELSGPREALMQLPPHGDDAAVRGRRWIEWAALDPNVAAPLEPLVAEIVAELRGGAASPPERIAWAMPGWYEQAADWIRRRLRDAGRADPDAIVQFRHWGISAVMRVDAPDGRAWFKASYPRFAHEGPVTAHLAATLDDGVPSVLAVEPGRGWLLVDDLGPTETTSFDDQAAAVDLLVAIQAAQAPHVDTLAELGCPVRPLTGFADEFDEALDSPVASDLGLSVAARRHLVASITDAADRLVQAGWTSTLVHGDFHPGNTAATASGPVIFDWTDACVSAPVVDLGTWAWWYARDDERQQEIWRWFTSAWERHLGVAADGFDRATVDIAAGAFHATGYVRLVEALEPRRRFESAEGVRHFVRVIESAAG